MTLSSRLLQRTLFLLIITPLTWAVINPLSTPAANFSCSKRQPLEAKSKKTVIPAFRQISNSWNCLAGGSAEQLISPNLKTRWEKRNSRDALLGTAAPCLPAWMLSQAVLTYFQNTVGPSRDLLCTLGLSANYPVHSLPLNMKMCLGKLGNWP